MPRTKKLTSKSGLTIPKDIRLELGFKPSMAIDMEITREGLLIRKHRPTCKFCDRTDHVEKCADMEICDACAIALKKELEVKHGIN